MVRVSSLSSKSIIRKLKDDGWFLVHTEGDHAQFKHPTKKGKVTVTHPVKDVPIRTIKSIERQAGLKLL